VAFAAERHASVTLGLSHIRRLLRLTGMNQHSMIIPWWPLAALAGFQLIDAALCWQPVAFVRDCLVDVRFPRRFWRVLPALKIASAAGLTIGIWFPPLALLTCAALVCYFVVAITMHVTARDFGRNLFVNATGMLVLCSAALGFVIVSA
jgi:hypothetical protein